VTENYNSSFYKILKEFKILTGHGILVNTSFNLHEEPIVCSPYDALRALHLKAIDYLAIENYLVKI
jgi:carbamoyltransferase